MDPQIIFVNRNTNIKKFKKDMLLKLHKIQILQIQYLIKAKIYYYNY